MTHRLTVGEYAKQFQRPDRPELIAKVKSALESPVSLDEAVNKTNLTHKEILSIVRSSPKEFFEFDGKLHRKS